MPKFQDVVFQITTFLKPNPTTVFKNGTKRTPWCWWMGADFTKSYWYFTMSERPVLYLDKILVAISPMKHIFLLTYQFWKSIKPIWCPSVDLCYFTTSQIKWNSLKRSCKNCYDVNKMFMSGRAKLGTIHPLTSGSPATCQEHSEEYSAGSETASACPTYFHLSTKINI